MPYFYVCVAPHAVYVKDGPYFEEQGGLEEEWGTHWRRVEAETREEARQIGIAVRRWRYPEAHVTLGEEAPEGYSAGFPKPREPQTDWERAEASAAEMRNDLEERPTA